MTQSVTPRASEGEPCAPDIGPAPALTDRDYRQLAEFRHALARFLAFSEQAARAVGLQPRQHQALLAIRGAPPDQPATVGFLAERLVIRHNSAVELADRLEQGGYLTRGADPSDRRRVRLSLTAQGDSVLARLSSRHRDEIRDTGPLLAATLDALRS